MFHKKQYQNILPSKVFIGKKTENDLESLVN